MVQYSNQPNQVSTSLEELQIILAKRYLSENLKGANMEDFIYQELVSLLVLDQ